MIKPIPSGWGVFDSSGRKLLGKHSSKSKALKQLRAIEISKHKRKKFAKGMSVIVNIKKNKSSMDKLLDIFDYFVSSEKEKNSCMSGSPLSGFSGAMGILKRVLSNHGEEEDESSEPSSEERTHG